MSQEDSAQSMMRLNHRRRGSNRIAPSKLAVSATGFVALVPVGAVVQRSRSDNNERRGEVRQEYQRQASGRMSEEESVRMR